MTASPELPNPALLQGTKDLVDEFTSTGWDGDLAGALAEAPFSPPEPDPGQTAGDWRPFFRDYLRGLSENVRDKYGIRER